jgi:hypothetical protein
VCESALSQKLGMTTHSLPFGCITKAALWKKGGATVLFILGTMTFVVGTAIVVASGRYPSRKTRLESWGGGCVVGGIALIGLAFPMI